MIRLSANRLWCEQKWTADVLTMYLSALILIHNSVLNIKQTANFATQGTSDYMLSLFADVQKQNIYM